MMPVRRRLAAPVLVAGTGFLLIFLGGARLPAELIDVPANPAAAALARGQFVNREGLALVLSTRMESIRRHSTAGRWFDIARARLAAGDAAAAVAAYRAGLTLAPANGVLWTEYARALRKAGKAGEARRALAHSIERAPHDPRAVQIRRRLRDGK